ncbi:MAG: IS5 family transposase [Candidatus Endonucleobacter sp. (ex Gigantidas childressi)]|nr:IS5 family transposase [Candidatus Endonucleobacter sp. (ex Gigantidas childressi)]
MGRFRTRLVEHRLWDQLLPEINRQIEAKNIIMSEGRINIIDATPIEAARSGSDHDKSGKPTKDPEASWHVKNDSRGNKKSTYGFSVRTGVDADDFIHRQSVTPGNVHDSQERDTLLRGDETALYADSSYSSEQTREKLAQLGIKDKVQRKGYRGKSLLKEDRTRNKEIAVKRAGGERLFAIYKRHYGLARTRFMGLAKNATIYGLAAIAANIRKGTKFLVLYDVSKPCYTG